MKNDWRYKLKENIELNRNSIPFHMVYLFYSSYSLLMPCSINKDANEDNIINLFVDFYTEIIKRDIKSTSDIDDILNVDKMISLSIKNGIISDEYFYIDDIYNQLLIYEEVKENKNRKDILIYKDIKLSEKIMVEMYSEYHHKQWIDCLEEFELGIYLEDAIIKMISSGICYIKALIKSIFVVSRYSNLIVLDEDLLIMYTNLIEDNSMDIINIIEEIYPIYIELYSDRFNYIMNSSELTVVLHARYIEDKKGDYFSEQIYEKLKSFMEPLLSYANSNVTIDDSFINDIIEYHCNENNIEEVNFTKYINIFGSVMYCLTRYYFEKIRIDDFLKIITSSYLNCRDYEKKSKKRALERRRDKLLSGNLY